VRPDTICGLLLLTAVAAFGCDSETSPAGPGGSTGGGGSGGDGGGGILDPGPPAWPKAIVRFKGAARLRLELSRVLDLAPTELCKELGAYDCLGIHTVVLGDPDAFFSGVYEPLPSTTSTSPLAVDRVVLSACSQRAALDLGGESVIFADLPVDDGALDADATEVEQAINRLYQRGLGRNAKPSEIAHHRQLYLDVEASGSSRAPAEDWATLSCFATLTSMEFLFY